MAAARDCGVSCHSHASQQRGRTASMRTMPPCGGPSNCIGGGGAAACCSYSPGACTCTGLCWCCCCGGGGWSPIGGSCTGLYGAGGGGGPCCGGGGRGLGTADGGATPRPNPPPPGNSRCCGGGPGAGGRPPPRPPPKSGPPAPRPRPRPLPPSKSPPPKPPPKAPPGGKDRATLETLALAQQRCRMRPRVPPHCQVLLILCSRRCRARRGCRAKLVPTSTIAAIKAAAPSASAAHLVLAGLFVGQRHRQRRTCRVRVQDDTAHRSHASALTRNRLMTQQLALYYFKPAPVTFKFLAIEP